VALSTAAVAVGECRDLNNAFLCGPIPSSIETLVNLGNLCVRPAPPPHLAMWGQLREARWVGEEGGEGRRVFV
jgi:hypothetical protein